MYRRSSIEHWEEFIWFSNLRQKTKNFFLCISDLSSFLTKGLNMDATVNKTTKQFGSQEQPKVVDDATAMFSKRLNSSAQPLDR